MFSCKVLRAKKYFLILWIFCTGFSRQRQSIIRAYALQKFTTIACQLEACFQHWVYNPRVKDSASFSAPHCQVCNFCCPEADHPSSQDLFTKISNYERQSSSILNSEVQTFKHIWASLYCYNLLSSSKPLNWTSFCEPCFYSTQMYQNFVHRPDISCFQLSDDLQFCRGWSHGRILWHHLQNPLSFQLQDKRMQMAKALRVLNCAIEGW